MKKLLFGAFLTLAAAATAPAIEIEWNYDYDSNDFFLDPQRRAVLEAVAAQFESISIASPDLNPPPGYWTWLVDNPSTGLQMEIPGALSAGKLVVYVGAYDLGGALGFGGPAGSQYLLDGFWSDQIEGLNTTAAYLPFAGSLTISNAADISWYDSVEDPPFSMSYDLFSVVTHELGHILGLGLGLGYIDAWDAHITDDGSAYFFNGPAATALYGAEIPLAVDGGHLGGITYEGEPLVLSASLANGERRYWSPLETAMLSDIGYVVIPEPGAIGLLAFGAGVFVWQRRRKAA